MGTILSGGGGLTGLGVWYMGGQEGLVLPSASAVDAAEDGYARSTQQQAPESNGAYVGDFSPELTVQTGKTVVDDVRDLPQPATPETIPARNRFVAWSRRYVLALAVADAIIAAAATAIPASISDTLSGQPYTVTVLCLIGMVVWPGAIAIRHGYRRSEIGLGISELRAVMRAGIVVVFVSALPTGFVGADRGEFTLYALLKLVVVAVPVAIVLSLVVRVAVRRVLPSLQESGRGIRNVVVVGSFDGARQLSERIQKEPCGMRVVGVCLPSAELPRPLIEGVPVLGSLAQVAEVVRTLGCDAVAVTSDDATRIGYLRELAWSLEGAGVELLVDPGLIEIAGPRMRIRPLIGFPLLHVEEPHFTGWRRILKRATDLVLTSVGLVVISPLLLAIAVAIKLQDGGPVIFRQARVGRGGEMFTMLKFRSMVIDAEVAEAGPGDAQRGRRRVVQAAAAIRGSPGSAASCGRSRSTSCRSCSTCSTVRCRWSAPDHICRRRSLGCPAKRSAAHW